MTIPRPGEYRQEAGVAAWHAAVCRSKFRYPSKKLAKSHARRIQKNWRAPLRAYHCVICGDWHLATKKTRPGVE